MAKKKKSASNPARGFATTSIPSKAKPEKEDVILNSENGTKAVIITPVDSNTATTQSTVAKDTVQPTPEELEEQLERDELQLLVEKYGAKVKRDSARLETRVQTDCRVLRGQAANIPLYPFLPDELKLQLIELVQKDALETGHSAQHSSWTKALAEEDTTIKCWTLFEALLSLGIDQESIKKVISELLKNPPTSDASTYIWGFREALDFLALNLNEDELPSYISGKTNTAGGEIDADDDLPSETLSESIPTPNLKAVPSR
jgi:ATP-dependent RNA helicase DHX29